MTESAVVYIDGNPIWLCVSVGEVVSQHKWSQTSVCTRANADVVSVSSVVSEKHEFWIKEADGKEVGVKLTDGGFQVRDGQKVWVAWAGKQGQDYGRNLFARNVTSGDDAELLSDWTAWLYQSGVISKPLLYCLFSIWLPILLGVLGGLLLSFAIFNDLHSFADTSHALHGCLADYGNCQSRLFGFLGKTTGFWNAIAVLMVFSAGFLTAWLPSFAGANIVGYVSFLHWRDKLLTALYKKKIFDKCSQMALMTAGNGKQS